MLQYFTQKEETPWRLGASYGEGMIMGFIKVFSGNHQMERFDSCIL